MDATYEQLSEILELLKKKEIDPIVYGSVAVSFYLGKYKDQFGDFDLLVEDTWLEDNWDEFKLFMAENGYVLTDAREHTFSHSVGTELNFAKESVLSRDGICDPKDTLRIHVAGRDVRTLSAENMLRAYEFSVNDGYRKAKRGKKDADVVDRLRSIS